MLYPVDVQKTSYEASRIVGKDRASLIIFGSISLFGFISLFTVPFFTSMGIAWYYPVGLQLLVFMTIFFFIFRFFIFKEDEKIREYQSSITDSFAKYFYMRNLESGEVLEVSRVNVPIFEFRNGSSVFVIKFLYGLNDNARSRNTRKFMEDLFRLLGGYGLEYMEIITPEKFTDSPEAKAYISKISNIKDRTVAKSMLEIAQTVFELSEEQSNVDCMYLRVRTKSSYQKYEIAGILQSILLMLSETRTCFRSASFLDKKELVEFIKQDYGLEAIDLSLMKAMDSENVEESFIRHVEVYQLVSSTGRVLTNPEVLDKAITTPRKLNI